MASTSAVYAAQDAMTRSDQATTNRGTTGYLEALGGAGAQREIYIQAPTPAIAADVTEAKLRLFQNGNASSGNRTLSVYRLTERWREDRINHNNRPARAATPTATATVTGAGTDGRLVEWNVLADVQKFYDGVVPNYGWVIVSSAAQLIAFRSSEAPLNVPQLVVTWADTPQPPTGLTPASGDVVALAKPRLRWSFIDLGGDTTLSAVQVHLKTANTGWTAAGGYSSPTWDSGTVATTQPELDLAAVTSPAYGGLASGASTWWTARHRDGAGLWSDWSDPHSFTYRPQPAGAIAYPAAGTPAAVEDTTFPVRWTTTDQTRYEVRILRAGRVVWSTAGASTSVRSVQVPRNVITTTDDHTVVVRLRDSYNRVDLPDAPASVELTRIIRYTPSGSVAPVTDLQVVAAADRPSVDLTWRRSAAPAAFAVIVDGVEHAIDTSAAFDDPTSSDPTAYRYRIVGVAKTVVHTFTVRAIDQVTSGSDTFTRASAANPSTEGSIDPVGVWLLDPDDEDTAVRFLEETGADIVSTTMPEATYTFEPVGATSTVAVTTALRGIEGTLTDGMLADWGDLDATELYQRLMVIKSYRLKRYRLIWGGQSLDVRVSDVNAVDASEPGAQRWKCSLAFAQADKPTDYELRV